MKKKSAGFSYVEVLAAGALFVIILVGALSLTLRTGQNLSFARDSQRIGLSANSISLAVRDMVLGNEQISCDSIRKLARGFGVERYSVFIFTPNGGYSHGSPFHSCENSENIAVSGFGTLAWGKDGRFVYVIVRNDYDNEVGRAVSLAIDIIHTSGIWRNARG